MTAPVRCLISGGSADLADRLAVALGVPTRYLGSPELVSAAADADLDDLDPHGVVWVHVTPAHLAADGALSEVDRLVVAAEAARTLSRRNAVVFIAALPSAGLFTGERGLAVELAVAAFSGIMRARIADWTRGGNRITGLVHSVHEIVADAGARPRDELVARTPTGEVPTFGDLVDALVFLGAPSTSYLSGSILTLDGGAAGYSWVYPTRTT